MSRIFIVVAGLYGALGVVFAASAAHGGGATTIGSAAQMLLFHAPALLAIGLYGRATRRTGWVLAAGGLIIFLGCGLFAGDLAMRYWRDTALFPMAAPSGGVLMILGWFLILVAGLLPVRD